MLSRRLSRYPSAAEASSDFSSSLAYSLLIRSTAASAPCLYVMRLHVAYSASGFPMPSERLHAWRWEQACMTSFVNTASGKASANAFRSGLFEPLKRLPTDAEGLVADFRGGDGPAAKEPQRLARFAERPEPHGQRRRDLRGVACHLAVDAERGKRIASRLLPPAVGVSHRRPPEAREDVSRADAVDCLTTATERDARDEFAHVGGEVP